jgi:hypothetical protein
MKYLFLAALLFGQKFQADDPIRRDNDAAVDAAAVAKHKLNDHYDFLLHTFGSPGSRSRSVAANINTLGEVPDSSWFENRHGAARMTAGELVRGANSGEGPSMEGPWLIVEAKTEGITPGFKIRDARGDVYFIKFDPASNPEMATAAEIISSRFFHAIGYNVPENYLAFFRREQVRVDGKASVGAAAGRSRHMTEADLDGILERVHRNADGTYRALASKLLKGSPLGPFQYFGTRPDDPNDIFPHEDRRELRGLGVFAAWLNHDDSRAINSLDMLVGGGRQACGPEAAQQPAAQGNHKFPATEVCNRHVKHYLIDFGSTLGSGSVGPQKPRPGWEYMWEPAAALKRIATLGLWDAGWVRVRYPDYPSVGRFESKEFRPEGWKPEYPNSAFLNATDEDGYWAAKIIMSFTDDDIRAIVRSGQLSDPRAEEYLHKTLIERRDKIGSFWLTRISSFDRFELRAGGGLTFEHLGSLYDFAPRPEYRLRWFRYDNLTDRRKPAEGFKPNEDGYFVAEIWSGEGSVNVYVRTGNGKADVVGIERKSKTRGGDTNE